MRCSIHFSLLAAGVGGWVVSCYNLCEDYWPNIEFAIQLSQYRGEGELILIQGMTPPFYGQGAQSHVRITNTREKYK